MTELDYLEDQARRNAAFSLENMDKLTQRAQGLQTLLLGGAGGAGAYALGQIGKPGGLWAVAALGVLSLWWFALAAWLAVKALPTHDVRAPAGDGWALLEHLRGPLAQWAKDVGEPPENHFPRLREGELKNLTETARRYREVNARLADRIDRIGVCAAFSPLPALLALAVVGAVV